MRVWPNDEAMEERLSAELSAGQARELDLTWDGLVDRLIAEVGDLAPLDELSERLALRAACRAASGLGSVAQTRGFVSGVARFVVEAERAGLGHVVPEGERARRLVAILAEHARIAARAGASRNRRRARAVRALGIVRVELPPLIVEPRLVWEPADVELLLALARTARVVVKVPWAPDRPIVYGGIDAVLAAFEARGQDTGLELALEDPAEHGCAQSVAAALYRPGAQAPAPRRSPVTVLAAPHAQGEARAVAAHIRALVDGGAAPESIAVAVRDGAVEGSFDEELDRVGLLLDDRRPRPLGATPPARLFLSLLALPGRGYPREDVLALMGSGYLACDVPAGAVARTARGLGLRTLAPDGEDLRRLAASPGGAPLADGVRAFLAPLAALPARASLVEHARALSALIVATGLDRPPRGVPWTEAGAASRRIVRAAARDLAATRALVELCARLPAAAAALGGGAAVDTAELVEVMTDLCAESPLPPPRSARGGAVRLVTLPDLASRRFDHVILPGLIQGQAPARAVDDGVYGERERRAIHRALGRRALPGGSGRAPAPGSETGGEPLPIERTPFEALLLVHALCAAERSVLLSYARASDDRPLTRSPFVDEVLRAAPWIPTIEATLAPVPPLETARAPQDLLARLALETMADPQGRLPPRAPAPGATALWDSLARRLPRRARRIAELASIERRRWAFFHGHEPENAWVGAIGPLAKVATIPARQLEQLAACGFTFLAGRLLGAAELEEAEDTPSALSLGRLAHRCLEVFYRGRAAGGAGDRAALQSACAEAFAAAEAQGLGGHPLLWQLSRERLVDELWQLVQNDAGGQSWNGVPTHFELPVRVELGGVTVTGRVDRVDRTAAGFVVVDYKLFGKAKFPEKLKAAGDSELQLPIYAAAVRAALGASAVDAAYISVRDGVASKTLSATLGAAELGTLLDAGLAARVGDLGGRVRSGALVVAPADRDRCQFCAYKTACRVVHDVTDDEAEAA